MSLDYRELKSKIETAEAPHPLEDKDWIAFQQNLEGPTSLTALLKLLREIDEAILQSQGQIVEMEGKRVALYNGSIPFSLQIPSLTARGLQHAYSAIKLIEWESLDNTPNTLRDYIQQYIQHMSLSSDFAMAQKITIDFIALMADHIAKERVKKNPPDDIPDDQQEAYFDSMYQQAFIDLKKATDLISSIEPNEDVICTYTRDESGQIQASISERITFKEKEHKKNFRDETWYKQNIEKHGAWFEEFVKEHGKDLLECSPVCTTRDLPNPSNAWRETSITFNHEGQVIQKQKSTRVAISSPFQIKDRQARVAMAFDSMQSILSDKALEDIAKATSDKWGSLLEGAGEITLPILHQTLVAPTFFYGADRDMIEVKSESNRALRNTLNESSKEVGGVRFKFSLLETNNCINMWHPIINPRNSDIDDSERLIQSASFLISQLKKQANPLDSNDLEQVLTFLSSQKRSWIMIKPFSNRDPNTDEQRAIVEVVNKLKTGDMKCSLDPKQQPELALMISAAVNLKKINHETHLGYAKRRLNNAVKINGISLLSPITGLLSAPVYLGRYLLNSASRLRGYLADGKPPNLKTVFLPTLNGYKNKQTFKSAYESIIAGQFGMVMGGCKSAYDRAGEAKVNQEAMINEFMKKDGKLPDFFDSDKAYYEYLGTVSKVEKAGHQNRVVAANDRIGARKLWEVLTHFFTQELDQAGRNMAKLAAKLRKVESSSSPEERKALVSRYDLNVKPDSEEVNSQGHFQNPNPALTYSLSHSQLPNQAKSAEKWDQPVDYVKPDYIKPNPGGHSKGRSG
jgi:hypothetical protein